MPPGGYALELSRNALTLAQLGFAAETEQLLAELAGVRSRPEESYILTSRGTLAFARGSFEAAIDLLEEGLPVLRAQYILFPRRSAPHGSDYALGAETLARTWDAIGRPEEGVRVLEEASREKSRFMWQKFDWMKAQLRLAELYRKVGREAEALAVEEELRRLLAHADPDLPMLRQLESQAPDAGP